MRKPTDSDEKTCGADLWPPPSHQNNARCRFSCRTKTETGRRRSGVNDEDATLAEEPQRLDWNSDSWCVSKTFQGLLLLPGLFKGTKISLFILPYFLYRFIWTSFYFLGCFQMCLNTSEKPNSAFKRRLETYDTYKRRGAFKDLLSLRNTHTHACLYRICVSRMCKLKYKCIFMWHNII